MEQLEKLRRNGFLNGGQKPEKQQTIQDAPEASQNLKVIDIVKKKLANGMDVDKILNKHLDELIALSEETGNELRELKNRSKKLARQERMNLITSSDASVARSQINVSFMELLDVIKEEAS